MAVVVDLPGRVRETFCGVADIFITTITEPERLGVAGVQLSYVRHIKVPYTSGQTPSVV